MEYLLEDELKGLGLDVDQVSPMGVYGAADLKTLYEVCFWSRLANRVQLVLFSGEVEDTASFNQLCNQYDWSAVFTADKTLAVEFHGESSFINNSMYGAQLLKDGVVDYFKQYGSRPTVDKKNPDIRLHAYLKKGKLTVSLDLLGYSLHQRGYRLIAGDAPLKENIAAALLIRAGWPKLAAEGYTLVDPFCGSATLLIEAAMMAANIAPGLLRQDQAFVNWEGHDAELCGIVIKEAQQKRQPIKNSIIGFDCDPRMLEVAAENCERMGLSESITLKQQSIKEYQSQPGPGLFICNPPYGDRLKDPLTLLPVYQDIGQALFAHAQGWTAAILTSNAMLAQAIGLRFDKHYNFFNGPLQVKLYCTHIDPNNRLNINSQNNLSANAQALYNRLSKNKKHLSKWLKRTKHSCYRLYDADLPDYAFAVDLYGNWAHVQEYAAPKEIPANKAKRRTIEMLQVLSQVLNIPLDRMVLKQRKRQRGAEQYQALDRSNKALIVTEGAAEFKVNLHDYLDTGLFLDHRPLRLRFGDTLQGKKLLNCFCYTATMSVQAALSGAITCNVDLSKTYLEWAKDNFRLNKITLNHHQFIRADCMQWLKSCQDKFDVIWLDPPSFSNSKSMETTLDIQRDQELLVDLAMNLLSPTGVLYFSSNLNKFKLSPVLSKKYTVKDITQQTLDEDFKRFKPAHHCYRLNLAC